MAYPLQPFLPTFRSLKEIGTHKGLAKIGDTVANLTYSLVKSRVIKKLDSRNVNRTILSNALKANDMKIYARNRADSHDMADTAEAFIGYMYIHELWTIDQIAEILWTSMQTSTMADEKIEIAAASDAFTQLLLKIKETLLPKFSCENENHDLGN